MQGVILKDLTWPEAREAFRRLPVAVLPVGAAAKEHGPHLPLGTDLIWAETLGAAAVERTPCVLLPTLSYGYYPAFVDWPGSVSLRPDVFIGVVTDIVRSVARHGIRRVAVLNTGVSTTAPLEIASRELYRELGVLVAVLLIEGLGAEYWRGVSAQRAGTHAEEKETSFMLHVRPDLVRADRLVDEIDDRGGPAFQTGTGGVRKVLLGRAMGTASGVHGQATLASAEKGRGLLDAMVRDVVSLIEALAKAPVPDGAV
ncbi:MAG: creatininase family protein [Armatimonadota bacterium]|nr:creatininase family protein [Armatimonadota bacterium]MDR7422210.1 creatininase family protein [Armatimonadota bacterium]MDR7454393.1 creatininase family protein [Armatimonadota bacterium]MDR7457708.1 creatininase family protein [Armatimonadota bacterium]MDR7495767.1 creatininase family protein [Armatimonadota bacterium]